MKVTVDSTGFVNRIHHTSLCKRRIYYIYHYGVLIYFFLKSSLVLDLVFVSWTLLLVRSPVDIR